MSLYNARLSRAPRGNRASFPGKSQGKGVDRRSIRARRDLSRSAEPVNPDDLADMLEAAKKTLRDLTGYSEYVELGNKLLPHQIAENIKGQLGEGQSVNINVTFAEDGTPTVTVTDSSVPTIGPADEKRYTAAGVTNPSAKGRPAAESVRIQLGKQTETIPVRNPSNVLRRPTPPSSNTKPTNGIRETRSIKELAKEGRIVDDPKAIDRMTRERVDIGLGPDPGTLIA